MLNICELPTILVITYYLSKMIGKMPILFWCMKKAVSNYFPVSLMPLWSNIVEKLLTQCIDDLLDQNYILKDNQ